MADGSRSSPDGAPAASAHPVWTRLLIPSTADTIFIALLAVLTCTSLSVRLLGDAGIGWHIRTGQQILASHVIPRVDSFSSTMSGKPWFAWEWLYDVMVGGLEHWAGLNGVVWLTSVVIAGVFAWTFRLLVRRGTNVFVALVLVLLAASASMIHFLARPHVVSWLFTVAWFWILDSSEKECSEKDSSEKDGSAGAATRSRQRLWALPLLMLVWVNLHGGFLVGFVLLAIYWLSAVWSEVSLREDKFSEFMPKMRWRARARNVEVAGLAVAVASLANPYGWRLHAHIYRYLTNRFLMEHIDEFQSPNFHGVAQRCFALLVLLVIVALAARPRELRVSEALVILFALYSGFYASRNIPASSLLLVLVMGPLLSGAIERLEGRRLPLRNLLAGMTELAERMGSVEETLKGHLWAIAGVAATCWIAAHGGRLGSTTLMDAHFDGKRFPIAAVDFLDRREAQERTAETGTAEDETARKSQPVTAPDYWGGYLIYRLSPRTLVTVDDRHDFYGEEFFKSYLKMVHVDPGWDGLLEKYQARRVLVPKGSPLANILELSPPWKIIYSDDIAVIFERPAGARLP
ncbi:MAG TPA: hypothetical protein VKR60_03265 [Candidatus Sulfotelmatobacter sp.]|nr:hypothetical protein [Candidatus Sulfotelmatobacter sp.]